MVGFAAFRLVFHELQLLLEEVSRTRRTSAICCERLLLYRAKIV